VAVVVIDSTKRQEKIPHTLKVGKGGMSDLRPCSGVGGNGKLKGFWEEGKGSLAEKKKPHVT